MYSLSIQTWDPIICTLLMIGSHDKFGIPDEGSKRASKGVMMNFHEQNQSCHPVGAPLVGAREASVLMGHEMLRCSQETIHCWS
jgi:hypothetical protein